MDVSMDVSMDVARRRRPRASTTTARVGSTMMMMMMMAFAIVPVSAKLSRGTVTLNSETTESVLGKFSVSKAGGSLDLRLSAAKNGWERGSHSLELLVMTDGEYFRWRDMKKKGSLCRDRNAVCSMRRSVALPHPGATHKAPGYEFFIDPESGDSYRLDLASGNTTWMHPHQHHGQTEVITHRETRFSMELKETEKMQSRTKVFEREVKSSWFFVLSDCALEFYPAKPPALHFDLDLRSDSKHLPEDLRGLGVIYGIALLGMAGTFAAFVVEGYRRYQTSKSVHALVLIVIFAHACQLGSLVLEYMHITVFSMNGKGLRWRYTWFAADFASDMLQGVSEFVVEFVLLFLVCGWTTLSMTLGGLGGSMFSLLESGGGGAPTDGIVQRRRETVHGGARHERVEILLQNQRRRPDGEIQGESHRERVAISREHAQARNGDDDRRRHLGVLRLGALSARVGVSQVQRRFRGVSRPRSLAGIRTRFHPNRVCDVVHRRRRFDVRDGEEPRRGFGFVY